MTKSFYENYWKIRGKSSSRPRYKIFSDWIEPHSKVLDIGCGDGYFGEFLVENKKVDYTGCDISETALEAAKNRGLKTMVVDASRELGNFEEKSFDFVVMSEFLEHIENSEEILKMAARIAKKGVLVSIPNIAYWRFRLQLLFGHFPKQWVLAPQEHIRFWSVKDFIKTIDSLSLRIKSVKSSNGKIFLRDFWPNLFGFQICFFILP